MDGKRRITPKPSGKNGDGVIAPEKLTWQSGSAAYSRPQRAFGVPRSTNVPAVKPVLMPRPQKITAVAKIASKANPMVTLTAATITGKKSRQVTFLEPNVDVAITNRKDEPEEVFTTPMSLIKQPKVARTPYLSAQNCSKCKLDRLESSSYWLAQIRLAETTGRHFVSAAFFRLALQCHAQPFYKLRSELSHYVTRHQVNSTESEWTSISQAYGLATEKWVYDSCGHAQHNSLLVEANDSINKHIDELRNVKLTRADFAENENLEPKFYTDLSDSDTHKGGSSNHGHEELTEMDVSKSPLTNTLTGSNGCKDGEVSEIKTSGFDVDLNSKLGSMDCSEQIERLGFSHSEVLDCGTQKSKFSKHGITNSAQVEQCVRDVPKISISCAQLEEGLHDVAEVSISSVQVEDNVHGATEVDMSCMQVEDNVHGATEVDISCIQVEKSFHEMTEDVDCNSEEKESGKIVDKGIALISTITDCTVRDETNISCVAHKLPGGKVSERKTRQVNAKKKNGLHSSRSSGLIKTSTSILSTSTSGKSLVGNQEISTALCNQTKNYDEKSRENRKKEITPKFATELSEYEAHKTEYSKHDSISYGKVDKSLLDVDAVQDDCCAEREYRKLEHYSSSSISTLSGSSGCVDITIARVVNNRPSRPSANTDRETLRGNQVSSKGSSNTPSWRNEGIRRKNRKNKMTGKIMKNKIDKPEDIE